MTQQGAQGNAGIKSIHRFKCTNFRNRLARIVGENQGREEACCAVSERRPSGVRRALSRERDEGRLHGNTLMYIHHMRASNTSPVATLLT